MKCFYHKNDLDGHCSGALIKLEFPECEMIGIDYGDEFPWGLFTQSPMNDSITKEVVFMVDFCLQPFSDMLRLKGLCNLVWIDHHKSAIGKYDGRMVLDTINHIGGLRLEGTGACELVWRHLYDSPVPYPVRLLAEYDVWNHSDANTLPFQYGMRVQETDPATEKGLVAWKSLLRLPKENYFNCRISEGITVLKHEAKLNARQCQYAFEGVWEERHYIAVNSSLTGSKLFESVWDPAKHDMMIAFFWTGKHWSVHMYSEIQSDTKGSVDVSEIAVKYGGGGHAGAAGFQCSSLPFMWGGLMHCPPKDTFKEANK